MAWLGGAAGSAAAAVGAGERGSATATLLAGAELAVVAVDRTPNALDELPEGIRREVGVTTDQAVAKTLIDPVAYGLSKAALSHLVRILDLDRHPHRIGMNAVASHLLYTSITGRVFPAEVPAHTIRPEAAADLIAFRASDRAAPVSGAVVPAHGA